MSSYGGDNEVIEATRPKTLAFVGGVETATVRMTRHFQVGSLRPRRADSTSRRHPSTFRWALKVALNLDVHILRERWNGYDWVGSSLVQEIRSH